MEIHLIGICGGTCSGKTQLARALLKCLGNKAACISADSYYKDLAHLSKAERVQVNFDHPDSIDWELLGEHLGLLKNGGSVQVPEYDFSRHRRHEAVVRVSARPFVFVEGILIFAVLEIFRLFDYTVYVYKD